MEYKKKLRNILTMFWTDVSLHTKLSIAFVAMTVLPIVFVVAIIWQPYETAMMNFIFERNQNVAEQIANDVDRMITEKLKYWKLVSKTAEIKSMYPNRQVSLLSNIASNNTDVQLVVISNAAGQQIARWDGTPANPAINYTDRNYYQQVVKTLDTAISDVLLAKSTGKLGIVIAEPIKADDQSLLGLVIMSIELQKLINRITDTKIGHTGYAYIVNSEGKLIIDPEHGLTDNMMDLSSQSPVKAATHGQSGWMEYEFDHQKRLAGYSYVPSAHWGVIAQQPLNEAMADVTRMKLISLIIVICAIFIAAVIGLVIANSLSKPISNISEATNRLAAGECTTKLQVTTRDEIGQLAANFNNMMTQLNKREHELKESEAKYHSLVDNLNIGIYRRPLDPTESFIQANPAMASILGFDSVEEFIKTPIINFYQNIDDRTAIMKEALCNGFIKNKEIAFQKKDGTPIWCSFTTTLQYDETGQILWIDGVLEDITERKRSEEALRQAHTELESQVQQRTQELTVLNEELRRISLLDGLTDIANRRYFNEYLNREWARAQREEIPLALIMIDVDFFKSYNDSYGHLAGDECLLLVATTLKAIAKRPFDLVARFGGEEFAIVLPNTNVRGGMIIAETARASIEKLAITHVNSLPYGIITISVGVASIVPTRDATLTSLIIAADQALYLAKQKGRNLVHAAS